MNPIIELLSAWSHSENGWEVRHYSVGDIVQVSAECAALAVELGYAKLLSAEDLAAAQAAQAKLLAAAAKARAAAEKAMQEAEAMLAQAQALQSQADAARVSRATLQAAAELPAEPAQKKAPAKAPAASVPPADSAAATQG